MAGYNGFTLSNTRNKNGGFDWLDSNGNVVKASQVAASSKGDFNTNLKNVLQIGANQGDRSSAQVLGELNNGTIFSSIFEQPTQQSNPQTTIWDNLFGTISKKAKSAENAIGTTLSVPLAYAKIAQTNKETEDLQKQLYANRDNIVKKYGFADYDAFSNAQEQAEAEGNETKYDNIWNELSAQTRADADKLKQASDDFRNWRENSYVGKKTNQDAGKFAGSAINTLSTAYDLSGLPQGIIANSVQGGIEGIADELEQNGLENFDAGRALNNATTGAVTGAVTGGLNKRIGNRMIQNGGSLINGQGKIANLANRALTSSAGRGAISGAVGGATGAYIGSRQSGQDIGTSLGNAIAGAGRGAVSGGVSGATTNLINKGINAATGGGLNRYYNNVNNAIEDFKASGDTLGERISNTIKQTNLPTPALTTEIVRAESNTPENKQPNQLPDNTEEDGTINKAFSTDGLKKIEKKNKAQSVGKQLQSAAKTQKYSAVYDSLDAKTARRAVETGAVDELANLGVQPQDYQDYAETSSYVNKVVSRLAKDSNVKVQAPDLTAKLSADNIDVIMSDSALKKYNSYVNKIVADGNNPDEYSASYLLEKSRELGNKAANLRGNTDDVNTLRTALTDAKYTLRDLATNALENSYVTGDDTNDQIALGLGKIGANQKVQDYYTAATADGKAPSVADYIRRSSLFEQARDMGTQIEAEKYTRSASKVPEKVTSKLWKASGFDQPVQAILSNTVAPVAAKATDLVGKVIEGVGNAYSGNTKGGDQTTTTNQGYPAGQNLWNVIGRTEGEIQGENAANGYINQAANAMAMEAPEEQNNNTLEGLVASNNVANNTGSVYGTVAGNSPLTMLGNTPANVLAIAMQLAADANDANAFAQLYSMYNDAAAETASDTASLNATQQGQLAKLESANVAIDELENLYAQAGGGQGVILGGLKNVAGELGLDSGVRTYNALAEGLINQIAAAVGKTDALNNEGEVNRALSLIPKITDDKTTAQNKLEELRRMLSQNTQVYRSIYGLQ